MAIQNGRKFKAPNLIASRATVADFAQEGARLPMAVPPRNPDLAAQRAAMQELAFLVGDWSGEAQILRGGADPVEMLQTEHAEFKLDGLLLLIEGIGRSKVEGKIALQALGIISYDDGTGSYRMRAFNDGRFLETEVKLAADHKALTWGFALGEIRTSSLLRMNERGQWTEVHEITIGTQPTRKFMAVTVSPVK